MAGVWGIIGPHARLLVTAMTTMFGLAIVGHLLIVLLLDRSSRTGIASPSAKVADWEFWTSWEGFQRLCQLCLVLLATLVGLVVIALAVTTVWQ
jgi:hypothetical protein